MRVIMGRKLAILAWRNSLREPCVRFWQHMRSSRTRSAITRSDATPSSSQKWPKCFAFTARSRCAGTADRDDAGEIVILSYDEKPGIQAIGNTTPDLAP